MYAFTIESYLFNQVSHTHSAYTLAKALVHNHGSTHISSMDRRNSNSMTPPFHMNFLAALMYPQGPCYVDGGHQSLPERKGIWTTSLIALRIDVVIIPSIYHLLLIAPVVVLSSYSLVFTHCNTG
jgi:hypothetical protein